MRQPQIIPHKIYDRSSLLHQVRRWRILGKTVAFTDASTRRLKGPLRPVNNQDARATVLASLLMVDAVVLFDEDTPLELIKLVEPDVLVKGGDYILDTIVGAKEVMAAGGRVVINPIIPGFSTTGLIEKITKL